MSKWQPIETAPYSPTWVLAWLHLPKNPPASGPVIAQRCFVEPERAHPDEGLGAYEPDCWWANGRYYPPGHVTHWMPLPEPPK